VSEVPEEAVAEQQRLATGTIAIQVARGVGIIVLFGVATALGRSLSLAEFGVYGLTLSFATAVIFIQGSVEAAAIRAVAQAGSQMERDRAFTATMASYLAFGTLAGLIIVAAGIGALSLFDIPSDLRSDARYGLIALGVLTMVGWPLTTYLNLLHGTQRFKLAAAVDIAGHLVFAALMTVLLVVDAPLWLLIAAGGSIPLSIGTAAAVVVWRERLPYHFRPHELEGSHVRGFLGFSTAVFLSAVTDIVIYSVDRAVLAAFRNAATVGLYEAVVRPQSLIRVLHGTLLVTVLPAATTYMAEDDEMRLRELLLRGTRYVMAVTTPLSIVLIVLASPILEVWLGSRYTEAATALGIYVVYWLFMPAATVGSSMLWAAGRTRVQVAIAWSVAGVNLVLSLVLTWQLGLEGVVLGTTIAYLVVFPFLLRVILDTFPVTVRAMATRAWLPAYLPGAALALVLLAANAALDLTSPLLLLAVVAVGLLGYWGAYYALCLSPDERVFFRGLVRRP
jgi:O-antigen/teichoic acid export membrane protein